ncbi:MAG: hypothetical protein CMO81_09495 [Waddliaceae bacterium]|nr:hypothetical protein [Waddliaceae bacterium]|tara:strand:- start:72 stop:1043 length:972 start_codon:yes stop_codon:yes gene_type:complete
MRIISHQRIWDHAGHNAFVDLLFNDPEWLCVFRESNSHMKHKDGVIRILASYDTKHWHSIGKLVQKGLDLRDPKISRCPDGRLMLLYGACRYWWGKCRSRRSYVCFSDDGRKWTKPKAILDQWDWLWKVTWYEGKAYGFSYGQSDKNDRFSSWHLTLWCSENGLQWNKIQTFPIHGNPNETAIQFLPDGRMLALVRRDGLVGDGAWLLKDNEAWIGVSKPPYIEWKWRNSGMYFGGPDLVLDPSRQLWACGRKLYKRRSDKKWAAKTVIARMGLTYLKPVLTLPSGGDTSYPGMIYRDSKLWIAYYSSHEGKSLIYFAIVEIA